MSFSVSVQVIKPKTSLAGKSWKSQLNTAMKKTGKELKGLFLKTTSGWSNKPIFRDTYSTTGDTIWVKVEPTGQYAETWKLVNAGSPAHDIRSKKGGLLSFKPGYRASTTPGSIMSKRNYRSGKLVGAKLVNHPGFEARRFTETIVDTYDQQFVENVQDAINVAARKK